MPIWEVNVSFMLKAKNREEAIKKVTKEIVGRLGVYDIFEVRKMSE